MHKIIAAIQSEIANVLRDKCLNDPLGKCLYITHTVATALHKHRLRPVIQSGSMQWPIMAREDDDGTVNTHFAYMWNPGDIASIISMAHGALPEMHVWCGLTQPQTIIDFSTRNLREHAEACGLTWRSGDPPEYLFRRTDQLPDWVVYTPNCEATLYACRILRSLFDPAYLRR
jgi:hypothetical protein